MHQSLLVAALVAIIGTTAADAATRRHKQPARATATAAAPAQRPQIGPPGSGPNQCWTDEGYGRFSPCDGGGKAGM